MPDTVLTIEQAPLNCLLQGAPRYGYRHLGVIAAGGLDPMALQEANILLGNTRAASCLEISAGPFCAIAKRDMTIAICGHGYRLTVTAAQRDSDNTVQTRQLPLNWRIAISRGEQLRLQPLNAEALCYLAIDGGFAAETFLGSNSSDTNLQRGGLQGRHIVAGDQLQAQANGEPPLTIAADLSPQGIRRPTPSATLRALAGPDQAIIPTAVENAFWSRPWQFSAARNRMGFRISAAETDTNTRRQATGAEQTAQADNSVNLELNSHAVIPGTVQLNSANEAIVLGADCQTSGGYPRVAVVIRADLGKLAAMPHNQAVTFLRVDRDEALQALRQQQAELARAELACTVKKC